MQLEVEMERYRVKIENKYAASTINKNYKFPRADDSRADSPFKPKKKDNSLTVSPVQSRGNKTEDRHAESNASNFEFGQKKATNFPINGQVKLNRNTENSKSDTKRQIQVNVGASPELKKINQRIQKKMHVTKLDARMITSNTPVIEMASVTLKNKQSEFAKAGGKPSGVMTS